MPTFNRWAIVESSYIFAHWLPPEQGQPILDRLSKLGFKPSLSVRQAAHAAHMAVGEHPISDALDREDYADTRQRVGRLLWRLRKMTYCGICGWFKSDVESRKVYPPPDPETGPMDSDLDWWWESICRDCLKTLDRPSHLSDVAD